MLIRAGRYREKLTITKPNLTLVGEARDTTVVTFDATADTKAPDGRPYGTAGCATLTVAARDFRAERLTVENAFEYLTNRAKPADDPTRVANAQAVALHTDKGSDPAAFFDVQLLGHQDTLFADSGRQLFRRCRIAGATDFVFGAGRVVLDHCEIVSRDLGSRTNNGYITAASTPRSSPYGLLFLECRLLKETPELADGSVALGRAWHPTTTLPDGARASDPDAVACVVYKSCFMDAHIATRGWESMGGTDRNGQPVTFSPTDARFYEYGSTGPGAPAAGARTLLTAAEAERYTAAAVLDGWLPVG